MYTLVTTFVRSGETNYKWKEIDISQMALEELCKRHREIVTVLDHTMVPGVRTMLFNDLWDELSPLSITLPQWLASIGMRTLPTVDGKPEIKTTSVYSTTASKAWIKSRITDGTSPIDSPVTQDMHHVYLTNEDVDMAKLFNHCLISINGYLHATDSDGVGIIVRDAVLSREVCGTSSIGIHSFEHIGELKCIPITPEMIRPLIEGMPLKERLVIDIGEDITDYSVAISIGGYLHINDRQFIRHSNSTSMSLLWQNQPWLQRYFESRERLDMSSLDLTKSSRNDELINVDELFSDEVIRRWLTMSQSFIILIKTSNLVTYIESPERGPGVNQFFTRRPPEAMMFTGYGRVAEHFPQNKNGLWILNLLDSVKDNYLFDYSAHTELNNVDNMGVGAFPSRPDYRGPAHFLHIESTELHLPK